MTCLGRWTILRFIFFLLLFFSLIFLCLVNVYRSGFFGGEFGSGFWTTFPVIFVCGETRKDVI